MNFEPFSGPGSTSARRALWGKVFASVISARKTEGKNASVTEYKGQGTLIAFRRDRGAGGECPCPRDIDEVNHIALVGNLCDPSCNFTAFHHWDRIGYLDTFTDPKQFKLYLDASCNVVFETNSEITDICDGGNTCGTITITRIEFSNTALTLGFECVSTCAFCGTNPCTATFPDTEIPFDSVCDLSAILDTYSAFQDCGSGTNIFAGVEIF